MTEEKKINNANPAPLGLLGFGMTTILLNIHNAGFFPLSSMIVGMGIFVGGLAQIIAGLKEWKKESTFGFTAFVSYGCFWLSLVAVWILPRLGLADAASKTSMAAYLFIWGLYTLVMYIGAIKLDKSLQFIFGTLTLLFFLLAYADYKDSLLFTMIAGFEGIICGLSAFYRAAGLILNEVYKKNILPL